MQSLFKPTNAFSVLCIVCLFLVSCAGKKEEKEPGGTTAEIKTAPGEPGLVAPPGANMLTAGSLDTLYIERAAFDTLNTGTKLYFSFTFSAADTLTLHGWRLRQNRFDSLPNIKLKNTNPSGLRYGVGTYFGNIVISPDEFNKIKTAMIAGKNYVLFAPYLRGKNIGYTIFVSDVLTTLEKKALVVDPTGAIANPSPPKVD